MAPQQDSTLQSSPAAGDGDEAFLVWGLTVAWHPDLGRIGERAALPGLAAGCEISRLAPRFARAGGAARPLEERRLSRQGLGLRLLPDGGLLAERRGSPTSLAVGGRPVAGELRLEPAELLRGVSLLLGDAVVLWLHRLDAQPDAELPRWGMVGDSAALAEVRRAIARVADLEVPVLVRGPTGSGKELVARAIHAAGPRRKGPFVAVNMAALPAELAAAELFGAARGAFTGATEKRPGYFAEAEGGTLFLDEIGETPEAVQPLLLRALESGEIQPLGGGRRRADARIVAATDADLEAAIAERRFRVPLYHRLRGFEIHLPPLAERREDIGPLLAALLAEEMNATGEAALLTSPSAWLPAALAERMLRAPWPGNVRQLKAALRQLAIASRGRGQAAPDFAFLAQLGPSPAAAATPAAGPAPPAEKGGPPRRPADIPESELVAAMRAARFRPREAAARLGIPSSSIYDLIARSRTLKAAAALDRATLEAAAAAHGGHVESMAAALEVSPSALRRRLRQLGLG